MNMRSGNHSSTFVPATIILSALWVGLLTTAIFIGDCDIKVIALTIVICFTGSVLGIPLGMLASPFKNEAKHFVRIGQLVVGFISGYLLSRADMLFEDLETDSELVVGRIFLFVGFLVLGAVQTFVFRRYYDKGREMDTFSENKGTEQKNTAGS